MLLCGLPFLFSIFLFYCFVSVLRWLVCGFSPLLAMEDCFVYLFITAAWIICEPLIPRAVFFLVVGELVGGEFRNSCVVFLFYTPEFLQGSRRIVECVV